MDYGKILSRAWEITWKWKALWALGFLAALGSGSGGGGGASGNVNFTFNQADWHMDWGDRLTNLSLPPAIIGLLVALGIIALFIGLALMVISTIARGGLIAGVQQVEDEGSTLFGRAWRAGARRFWTLLGIRLLMFLVVAVPVLILGGISAAVFFSQRGWSESLSSGAMPALGFVPLAICCGLPAICGIVLLAVFLSLITTYAERAAVLEGKGAINALKRAWQVLKTYPGPTILLGLIFVALAIGIAIVIGIVLLPIALPLVALLAGTQPALWWIVPITIGGLVIILLGAVVNSVVTAFTSAAWTLAYRQLAGVPAETAALPAQETPPQS